MSGFMQEAENLEQDFSGNNNGNNQQQGGFDQNNSNNDQQSGNNGGGFMKTAERTGEDGMINQGKSS